MEANTSLLTHEGKKSFKLVKWKVKPGSRIESGNFILMCAYLDEEKNQAKKLFSTKKGSVHELVAKEGDIIKEGDVLLVLKTGCSHRTFFKDMCAECGAMLKDLNIDHSSHMAKSVSMIHSVPELRVDKQVAEEIGKEDKNRLIEFRKLVLLVDLDQTLIHTTNDQVQSVIKDVFHFQLYGPNSPWYHTRVRPGTAEFLEKMSKMFELHICTFGARLYAHTIANHLDPSKKFFSHRILSRDECFNSTSKTANLKDLFPSGDSMVCIIDDREDVWNFVKNLVPVKPYNFFESTGDINAPVCKDPIKRKQSVDLSDSTENKSKKAKMLQNLSDQIEVLFMQGMEGKEKSQEAEDITNVETIDQSNKLAAPVEEVKTRHKKIEAVEPKTVSSEKEESEQIIANENGSSHNSTKKEVIDEVKPEIVKEKIELEEISNNSDQKENADKLKTEKEGTGEDIGSSESFNKEEKPEKMEIVQEHKSTEELKPVEEKDEDAALVQNNAEEIPSSVTDTGVIDKDAEKLPEKVNQEQEKLEASGTEESSQEKVVSPENNNNKNDVMNNQNMIDYNNKIDDDDYLLYLEDILASIHKAYFDEYDNLSKERKKDSIPELKELIPRLRRLILKDVVIVFSGVIPTNYPPERSKIWYLAKVLGAEIASEITDKTTHLIASKWGTVKVNKASQNKNIHIVTPHWLICCGERWSRVEESLFRFQKDTVYVPLKVCGNLPEDVYRKNFPLPNPSSSSPDAKASTYKDSMISELNPLHYLSKTQLSEMDKEVDDLINTDDSSSDDDDDEDSTNAYEEEASPNRIQLGSDISMNSSEDEDSLTSDEFPHGWKKSLSAAIDMEMDYASAPETDDD